MTLTYDQIFQYCTFIDKKMKQKKIPKIIRAIINISFAENLLKARTVTGYLALKQDEVIRP